jgi:hypothetical protein
MLQSHLSAVMVFFRRAWLLARVLAAGCVASHGPEVTGMFAFPTLGAGDPVVFDQIRCFFVGLDYPELLDRSLAVLQVMSIRSAESLQGNRAKYACSGSCEIDRCE